MHIHFVQTPKNSICELRPWFLPPYPGQVCYEVSTLHQKIYLCNIKSHFHRLDAISVKVINLIHVQLLSYFRYPQYNALASSDETKRKKKQILPRRFRTKLVKLLVNAASVS